MGIPESEGVRDPDTVPDLVNGCVAGLSNAVGVTVGDSLDTADGD